MSKDKFQLFSELYENGIRFIKDENSMQDGIFRTDKHGKVSGYTVKGIKKLAENKKVILDDKPLTPDEVEIVFNAIAFDRSIKVNEI